MNDLLFLLFVSVLWGSLIIYLSKPECLFREEEDES